MKLNKTNQDTVWMTVVFAVLLGMFIVLTSFTLTGCYKQQDGQQGPMGRPGNPAPPTAILVQPASPYDCNFGGSVITVGDNTTIICNGADGSVGPSGPQGTPGVNPTPVQVVAFCPGITVYPGVFVEIGLLINNRLYAVYSQNSGFLTELPPGHYASNAIGSSCNFTVNPDLTISH